MLRLKGILNVPRKSDPCSKVCELLLLVELLRLRRPDLRPVEPESLISLVGLQKRRPPVRSDAVPAEEFIKESIAEIPGPKPKNELALFMDALRDLTRTRVPMPPPETFDPVLTGSAAGLRERLDASVQEALSRKGLIAVPLPGFAPDIPEERREPLLRIRLPLSVRIVKRVLVDPGLSEPICRFVGAFFLGALLRPETPPRVRAAAGVAAFGCSIGVSRGT